MDKKYLVTISTGKQKHNALKISVKIISGFLYKRPICTDI